MFVWRPTIVFPLSGILSGTTMKIDLHGRGPGKLHGTRNRLGQCVRPGELLHSRTVTSPDSIGANSMTGVVIADDEKAYAYS